MNDWVALVVLAFVDATAALLLANGMKSIGEIDTLNPRNLARIAGSAVKSPSLQMGFFLETGNFFLFMIILSRVDLSLVIPIMGSASYLISILGAKIFLKEHLTRERMIGSILIGMGIFLVAL